MNNTAEVSIQAFQPHKIDAFLYVGDSYKLTVRFKDDQGPVNIAQEFSDLTYSIFRANQHSDPDNQPELTVDDDVLTVKLTPLQTYDIGKSIHYYELKVVHNDKVKTLLHGRYYVNDVRTVGNWGATTTNDITINLS
jgi:hypothetical protein